MITQKDTEIEELQKSIQEDRGIAEDENEDQAIREKVIERNVALDNDREELEEGTSQRVRVRNILKKYGFTVSAVVLAVGTTIGVISDTKPSVCCQRSYSWKSDCGNSPRSLPYKGYVLLPHASYSELLDQ